jgi:hypothetical protein
MNIQVHTQDHIELMAMFETITKKHAAKSYRFDRENKADWKLGRIYEDGELNELFKMFRQGIAYGIAKARD